jgi:2-oxoglutarate ferredoxin oxidoreductase subunit beta
MTMHPHSRPPDALVDRQTHYCPGCGHGIVHKLIAESVDKLEIRESVVGIAPVGCSILAYFYMDFDVVEAAHGRTPAVATGIKRVTPDKVVFAYQGDGDLAAIGMAETIHAANRGEHIAVFFINNALYGMTGGQMAPTTMTGQRTATSPRGRDVDTMGPPIRMCELLNTLDMPYYIERVAIDGPAGVRKTRKAVHTALQNQVEGKGYSFVEILSPCPTYMRLSPVDSITYVKESMEPVFPLGVFRKNGEVVDA